VEVEAPLAEKPASPSLLIAPPEAPAPLAAKPEPAPQPQTASIARPAAPTAAAAQGTDG
jgi:hypothetical protein